MIILGVQYFYQCHFYYVEPTFLLLALVINVIHILCFIFIYMYISVFFPTIIVGYVFSQFPPYIAGWFFTFSLLSVLMHCFLLPPDGGRMRAACMHLYIFVYCFVAACL